MEEQPSVPMDRLAKVYLKIRNEIQLRTKAFEEEIGVLEVQKKEIADAMRDQMKLIGSKSVRTDFGTVVMKVKTVFGMQDWDGFKEFIVQNNALDLLQRRIAQKNMEKFLEDSPDVQVPGLTSNSEYEITVTKPK
jgi:hypothetical protein